MLAWGGRTRRCCWRSWRKACASVGSPWPTRARNADGRRGPDADERGLIQVSKSDEFRILGRHKGDEASIRFEYQGVAFDQDCFHVVAGLNAVDTREYTEQTFKALQGFG